MVDGNVVATATGQDSEALNWVAWNVATCRASRPRSRSWTTTPAAGATSSSTTSSSPTRPPSRSPSRPPSTCSSTARSSRTATGPNSESWTGPAGTSAIWPVRPPTIQIVDNNTGGWGHILADQFTFADAPALSSTQRAHWLDYGRDFYAGVTFNNVPHGKRIMIAWMNNWHYGGNIPTDPWRSAMSVPRILHLKTISGKPRLTFAPVQSLALLRRPQPFTATNTHLLPGTTTLRGRGSSGDTLDIVAKFRARDAEKFGLKVRVGNGQHTTIGYDVHRGGIYLDRTKSGNVAFSSKFPSVEFAPLKLQGGMVTLRVLVDRSSVEVFANDGQVTITDQIFPDRDSQAVQLFSTGGRAQLQEITIWHLKSIWQ